MVSTSPTLPATRVILFPTYAFQTSQGEWRIELCGAVYRPSVVRFRQKLLVKLLRRVMRVPVACFRTPQFRDRITPFIAAPSRKRRLLVQLGERRLTLRRRSRRTAFFRKVLRAKSAMPPLCREASTRDASSLLPSPSLPSPSLSSVANPWRQVTVAASESGATVAGRVQFIQPRGLSVVSDIDDTIKESHVKSRRELLANTFLRPFEPIEGMAARYRAWGEQGACFHYVSSSPWQLCEPLDEFLAEHGFPEGTLHLRLFQLGRHMVRKLLRLRRPGKASAIRDLLRRFPQRRFILVGDAGQQDPEIYGDLARRFPGQVAAILIRDIPGQPLSEERGERAFRQLPAGLWRRFGSGADIPETLDALFALPEPLLAGAR